MRPASERDCSCSETIRFNASSFMPLINLRMSGISGYSVKALMIHDIFAKLKINVETNYNFRNSYYKLHKNFRHDCAFLRIELSRVDLQLNATNYKNESILRLAILFLTIPEALKYVLYILHR